MSYNYGYGFGPMQPPPQSNTGKKILLFIIFILFLVAAGFGIYFAVKSFKEKNADGTDTNGGTDSNGGTEPEPEPVLPDQSLYSVFSSSRKDTCSSLDEHCNDAEIYNGSSKLLGKIFAEQVTGTIPLYSGYSTSRKDSCLSNEANCEGQKDTGGEYNDNGIIGYVYEEDQGDDYVPIYRTFSTKRKDSCVSLEENCGNQKDIYDGTVKTLGYVYTG